MKTAPESVCIIGPAQRPREKIGSAVVTATIGGVRFGSVRVDNPAQRICLLLILLSCICPFELLCAQEQEIWQMAHSAWSNREGSPRDIQRVAQGLDGVLWVGSYHGVATFDGFAFRAVSTPDDSSGELNKPIWQLLTAKDGSIWFATYSGGAFRLQNNHLTSFAKAKGGEAIQNLGSLQQDNRGALWCVYNDQYAAFLDKDGLWNRIALPLANGEHIQGFLIDSSGTRWIIQQNKLYRQTTTDAGFVPLPLRVNGPTIIQEDSNRNVWISGPIKTLNRRAKPETVLYRVSASGLILQSIVVLGDAENFFVDDKGSVWFAVAGDGLTKVRIDPTEKHLSLSDGHGFRRPDGLTSNEVNAFFEDRDGNVWIGGSRGLDRFTHAKLVPAIHSLADGLWSTCVDPQGGLLAGGRYAGLFRLRNGKKIKVGSTREIDALFCSVWSAWVLDRNGVAQIQGDQLRRIPLLPDHSGFWDDYVLMSVCEVSPGKLFASASGANEDDLWVFDEKRWRRIGGADRFGRVLSIATDDMGRVYFERRDGKIDVLTADRFEFPIVEEGQIGPVNGFVSTTEGFVAFGSRGVSLERGNRFIPIQLADVHVGLRVTGLVQGKNGDFWLNSQAGVNRIPLAEIRTSEKNPDYKVDSQQITSPAENAPIPVTISGGSAHREGNGSLWFSTTDGVVSIDPNDVSKPISPQLKIVSILGDDKPPESGGKFKAGLRTLRVQYMGIQMTDPSSVNYRYRLRGNDIQWQDVGQRREAVYTNLQPGTYSFEVIASSDSKMWTNPVQSEPFRILPYFWETWWFLLLVFGTVAWGLRLLYQQRLRTMRQRARMLAEERAEERTRIARELHDTLLQGIQGLLLNFEAVRQKLSHGGEVMDLLDRSLSATEALVVEGRERIATIRQENTYADTLHRRLKALSTSLSGQSGVEVHFKSIGTVRDMYAVASEELYFIAREAIRNALKHSSATHVRLVLYYNERLFRMECRDNGVGFDVSKELLQSDLRTKWGLQGMRERAESVRAQLSMTSDVGTGTLIEVRLDSKFAYVDDRNHL